MGGCMFTLLGKHILSSKADKYANLFEEEEFSGKKGTSSQLLSVTEMTSLFDDRKQKYRRGQTAQILDHSRTQNAAMREKYGQGDGTSTPSDSKSKKKKKSKR